MSNRIFFISLGAALLVAVIVLGGVKVGGLGTCQNFDQAKLKTPAITLQVAVAKNEVEQARGLAGCRQVPQGSGMYFPFAPKSMPVFWMKGMVIPIDIVWIAEGKVVATYAFVQPPAAQKDQELIRYQPPRPVDAVLEVGAGKAQDYGLANGASVTLLDR